MVRAAQVTLRSSVAETKTVRADFTGVFVTTSVVFASPGLCAATPAFGNSVSYMGGVSPFGIASADINHDSKLDLVTSNSSLNLVNLFINNGTGSFTLGSSAAVGSTPQGIAVGDFNGDSNKDLVVANSGGTTVSVLLGTGGGGFSAGHRENGRHRTERRCRWRLQR